MPELPEVETVARGLALRMVGKTFAKVEQRRPDLRFPLPVDFARRLTGRGITAIRRRAKYLLIDLDDGQVVLGHLGMSGRMLVSDTRPEALETHDHLVFTLDDGVCVRFNDARRFGMMDLVPLAELDQHKLLRDLGPEPLGNEFNGPTLAAALKGKKTPIKSAILDQKLVVGVGNIYASESLFRAGLSPKRVAATVQGERAERLAASIKQVLTEAIAAGGSSLRDYVQADGELGYFQHQWKVYDREGQPCPGCDCDHARTGGIRRLAQSGRSTFYCSKRQR
ncbi:MAG TPA: bifunctional DNA-formamidopyrimidine glycosylase/DNA-(apurinic or apyrimidinic site) lyase [Terriglobales bacterium]|nr:bifunctional DNA-formamidopyrimidine glycosylase/DNA-(apurinic or apyrimidinic site) lyase [Terriglobales bacterium]